MKTMNRILSALLVFALIIGFVPAIAQAAENVAVVEFANAENFDLYSTSAGGFQVIDGKLVPTGDAGEFKAIFKDNGQPIKAVSVEMHPNGNDGMYGGLYIGASNPSNGQDAIDALYVGIESHFTGWEDAPNRVDIILGQFAQGWAGEPVGGRYVSETGLNNALFSGGNKQPIRIRALMEGNVVTVTVSLVNDPAKQVSTVYTLPEGTELSLGDVGIRSHYNNASYDNFTVEYAVQEEEAEDMPSFVQDFDDTNDMSLYATSAGGFQAVNGKLVPTGDAGEFKAIYNESGKKINSVSVELHPHGNDGPIYGGLYINASNAQNGQDQINAMYIGIESNMTGWEDAPNRVDLVVGQFPTWVEHARVISETGANNALFAGGVKEPITLRVDFAGPIVTITVSLVRDPSVHFGTTYIADSDLSLGQVGIRSHYNDASYDNFCVNAAPAAAAAVVDFENADAFDLYAAGNGSFGAVEGKLVPLGEPTELKAIYKESGKRIDSVSVELHPVGDDGPIYGGLYIGASNAQNDQDQIDAIYIGVESNFTGWDDAINRTDLVIGQFPAWAEHSRVVAETGNGNALFAGKKEPLLLKAELDGKTVTVTLSLLRDPSKFVTASYTATRDLSMGQVGIRSHHNNAVYDNFAVNTAAVANGQGYATVSQAVKMAGSNVIKLMGSTDEVITVTGDTTIDLAGYNLTNLFATEGSSLKLADSSGDDFTEPRGWALVAGAAQPFAQADGKSYLVYAQENLCTAHRFDAVITHISLDPTKDALGYKASVQGDEIVRNHVTGMGFNLWLDDTNGKAFPVDGKQEITLRLKNILANKGGEMNIHATAFVTLSAGEQIATHTGAEQTTTMRQTLQLIDSAWMDYTQAQADAVLALCNQYYDVTSQWELNNIFYVGENFDDPKNRGEQDIRFPANPTYQNGQDIDGQWGVGTYTNGGEYGIGDPFVMRYNGKYYMYPSSGTADNDTAGVKVFSSEDLVNWTYEGFALEAVEADRAYAPEVMYYNGWFFMCQSGSKEVDGVIKGGQGHYIYKSQSPTGPFEKITDDFGYGIDGAMWINDNGDLFFMYAKSYSVRIVPMDKQTMKPISGTNVHTVLNAVMPPMEGKSNWVEGPGLFRRGDYLYLTYSGNKVTQDVYRIGYSWQKGSNPLDNFTQPENNILMLETGPDNFRGLGHNSNVIGPDLDSWYVAYHNLVSVDGPQRRYMLDKLVTNGAQVMANGPTYWRTDAPNRPDFEIRDINAPQGGLWCGSKASEAVFTAEANFTPAQGSITRVAFGYVDSNNYAEAVWDDGAKTLTVNSVKNGTKTTLGSAKIDFLSVGVLHTLRIEQGAERLMVYMDTMRKIDVAYAGTAGMLGLEGNFGYVAFSNNAFGTSDFDTIKQVEGTFPAVHYLKGENRGFHIANATVGGIRQGEKESTVCGENDVYSLKLDTAGDWVKYAIAVNAEGIYDLSAVLGESTGKFQVIVDSCDIYEVDLETAGDVLAQLNLTAGKHTLKIRLREGSLIATSFTLALPVVEDVPEVTE